MKKLLLTAMLMGSAFAANAQEITFAMEPSYPPFETTNEKGEIIDKARVRGYPFNLFLDSDLNLKKTVPGHLGAEQIRVFAEK